MEMKNIQSVTAAISTFERETSSKFVILQKSKSFGEDWKNTNKNVKKSPVIHWQSQRGLNAPEIPYDGTPYIHLGRLVLVCHLGKDYGKKKKEDYKKKTEKKMKEDHVYIKRRKMFQSTKKQNCSAQIYVSQVVRFPGFKITQNTTWHRAETSKRLRHSLSDASEIEGVVEYYMQFPSGHCNHPTTGQVACLREPVDAEVVNKIKCLTKSGVRSVAEMTRHIKSFVNTEAGILNEDKNRRRFNPTSQDIRNIMTKAKMADRKSENDQENLRSIIEEWQKREPEDKIFYREAHFVEEERKGFLFIYQSQWQQRLLNKYGNDLCLLDATYRTVKYAMPLFFLCVKTNVNYSVVAIFMPEHEDEKSIREALRILKSWNPRWTPRDFLADYCLAEINAVEKTFEGLVVRLCMFHREKAWNEWLAKASHGVTDHRIELKRKFRDIANATTELDYATACEKLKNMPIWGSNQKLREWFSRTWLTEKKRWVRAFLQTSGPLSTIFTTNGVERQNELLKHSFLVGYKKCSVSDLMTVILTTFLPSCYKKYVQLNVFASSAYRPYADSVPYYLRDRPQWSLKDLLVCITKVK
ncbi:uncharacterized protein LOC106168368 [Lingula anatina]|uniref:Uncharacterized protein LOC106168368 n=1 Tax=Lingula anatina TaxID=7574 RepID=A0A1S3IXZ5_LINAN|nr:uncharacterized protein LOC106168368 [Lingula anatina]|eukprot:XP_013402856.1 uncharacterized protein LOC106168368 [Lingula anatina]